MTIYLLRIGSTTPTVPNHRHRIAGAKQDHLMSSTHDRTGSNDPRRSPDRDRRNVARETFYQQTGRRSGHRRHDRPLLDQRQKALGPRASNHRQVSRSGGLKDRRPDQPEAEVSKPRRRRRNHVSLKQKLAAALAATLPPDQVNDLRRQQVSAETVIGLFHFDHGVLHALGGSDFWFNLYPMLTEPHREKSRRDTSIVAKVRR